MKLKLFIISLCCLFLGLVATKAQGTSDSLKISLLTYSPLPDVSGAFGHSAIRIQDFKRDTDVLYNYGIYDSYTDNFIMKFLRGKLEYQIGKGSTQRMINRQKAKGTRQIVEQEIHLTLDEQQKIIQRLEENYLPENRKYLYDFFFDNCATRIRDIVEDALGDELSYSSGLDEEITLRQLLDIHVASRPWTDFGMDLLVGLPADKKATYREQMFLPGFLAQNLKEGINLTRFDSKQLLSEKEIIVDGENYMNKPSWLTPFVLFGILCLLMLVLTLIYRHNGIVPVLDGILFLVFGIVGLILMFMWFGTDHAATKWNLNVLWANPLYLFLFYPIMKRKKKAMQIGYGLALLASIIILLSWGRFPQQFHIGVLPIIVMMLVRSGSAFLYLKKD